MGDLLLRSAGVSDAAVLGALNEQLIEDEGHDNPLRGDRLVERMRGFLTDGYAAALGTVDGWPAVYALWRPDPDGGIYLRHFFVAREYRRLGLGRATLAELRTRFWPAGSRLTLDVLAANERGIAFWRSVGFRERHIAMVLPGGSAAQPPGRSSAFSSP